MAGNNIKKRSTSQGYYQIKSDNSGSTFISVFKKPKCLFFCGIVLFTLYCLLQQHTLVGNNQEEQNETAGKLNREQSQLKNILQYKMYQNIQSLADWILPEKSQVLFPGQSDLSFDLKRAIELNNFDHIWEPQQSYGIVNDDQSNDQILVDLTKSSQQANARVSGLPNLTLRYTACAGLMNQQYSHISALILGKELGADVILSQSAQRDSFKSYFSMNKRRNRMTWTPAPVDGLLDVEHIIKHWRSKGITIRRPGPLFAFPDFNNADGAFPTYVLPGYKQNQYIQIGSVYAKGYDLNTLANRAIDEIAAHVDKVQKTENVTLKSVVVDLPLYNKLAVQKNGGQSSMSVTRSIIPKAQDAAKNLKFSKQVKKLAFDVLKGMNMATGVGGNFNGVHLRIENDAIDWANAFGGRGNLWMMYLRAMKDAQFQPTEYAYLATGLLSYNHMEELQNIIKMMKSTGFCIDVHYKEQYLTEDQLKGLTSEQKALVDLLVLIRSNKFVGFSASTFSYYIKEYRTLMGMYPTQSYLVDASRIGTDAMFKKNAVLN